MVPHCHRIVHAYLAEQIQLHDLSWQLYQDALYSDYNDIKVEQLPKVFILVSWRQH